MSNSCMYCHQVEFLHQLIPIYSERLCTNTLQLKAVTSCKGFESELGKTQIEYFDSSFSESATFF